ncbi:hypothetical protein [Ruegeria sp. Alg231-54]|uniref:hypothetical protein n=1 Tax=Ruegeria sp. Alg231-54 TaxID=1922221 RepID=UPI00131F1A67|nr:hypothetical protein [Ruegeria sp. Alg231-54]
MAVPGNPTLVVEVIVTNDISPEKMELIRQSGDTLLKLDLTKANILAGMPEIERIAKIGLGPIQLGKLVKRQ